MVEGRRGPNASHPRPATITSALPTTRALTSRGSAAKRRPRRSAARRPTGAAPPRGRGGRELLRPRAGQPAVARLRPQRHTPSAGRAGPGVRRHLRHGHHRRTSRPGRAASPRTPRPAGATWGRMRRMGRLPAFEDLGHGITAIDTGYVRPFFDASHLVVENGRAAFVDVGTSHSAPGLLAVLEAKGLRPEAVDYVIVTHVHLDHAGGAGEMMRRLPRARLVVHPRGARHMVDPSKLWAGASAVFGEEAMRPQLRRARARRPLADRRGARGLRPRAGRTAAPLPRHARPRAAPLLRLGRGLAVDVHRGHLRPLLPRARERARGVHPAHHDPGAVRAGGAPRLDRPAGGATRRRRCSSPTTPASSRSGGWPPTCGGRSASSWRSGRAEDGKRDRAARLRAGVEELFLGWVARPRHAPAGRARARAAGRGRRAQRPGPRGLARPRRRVVP